MKWPKLSILNIQNDIFMSKDTDYSFGILKMLLKNEKLKELNINGLCVSCDSFERFREALRSRKKRLVYINFNHEVTLKQFIELDREFGGRINFRKMEFLIDETIDKKYLNHLN